jgi:N-acyl homoserine lactone hydrolase
VIVQQIDHKDTDPRPIDAYHYIKRALDTEKGEVTFAHDLDVFKAHKHSPEFYE